jgi:iron-sulfur cluster assembly protein
MAIALTDNAVEEIRRQAAKGCTGFSYLFEWNDGAPRDKDNVFEKGGVRVLVDPKSLVYLDGTELDFVKNMMGHGFKFNNPNAKGACGCGESVQF